MSKKKTLVLVSQSQLARIDVGGGKRAQVQNVWTRERPRDESLGTLVDAALRLGPKKANEIWVFSTEFWTGVVHLASDVAAALEGEELDQAIGLEAETYSGISAFESRIGTCDLPKDESGESRWWVTQVSNSDWQNAAQAVKQFGGKLAGIGHASLALSPILSSDEPTMMEEQGHWRLQHCFGESTIALKGTGTQINDVITLGDIKTRRNQTQLLDWCESSSAANESVTWITDGQSLEHFDCSSSTVITLANSVDPEAGSQLPPDSIASADTSEHHLAGDDALTAWSQTMAASLNIGRNGDDRQLPVALAQKQPMTDKTAMLVACGLGLILALGCFGSYWVTSTRIKDLDAQIEMLNAQKRQLSTADAEVKKSQKTLDKKNDEAESLRVTNRELASKLQQAQQMRKFQQTRWLHLMTALAESVEGDCWVRGLKTNDRDVKVQGLAANNRDVAHFASQLEKIASPHGWKVHPAQMELNEMSLVEFEVTLNATDRTQGQVKLNLSRANASEILAQRTEVTPTNNSSAIDFENAR